MPFRLACKVLALSLSTLVISACSSSNKQAPTATEPQATDFSLNFKAMSGDLELNCNDIYDGLGPNSDFSVGVGDLRFYVSNLKFYDAEGAEISVTLNDNDFQLNHSSGSVSLIDFTNRDSGFCEDAQLGTPRTNTVITGTASDDAIASVSFDVGVPQAVMKAVTADAANLTDAPSPLAEMTWGWANGYRHIDLNFTTMNSENQTLVQNSGFHIGSKDCGTANKALAEQDTCGLINTPTVMLNNFDPANNSITFDIENLFANTQASDYSAMIMSPIEDGDESACILINGEKMVHNGMCATGMKFGILCHSKQSEAACNSIFPSLGLNIETGTADSASNSVFGME